MSYKNGLYLMLNFKFLFCLLFALNTLQTLCNDILTKDSTSNFRLDLEFRPRSEYRHGYRTLMPEDATAAFFTDQRARLNITYTCKDFTFYTSIQDIRTWGDTDPRSTVGSIQAFEAYAEPNIFDDLKIRIGRQKIIYDNERLFAQNDWRQNGGSHDAIRLMYNINSFSTDFIAAYNQEKGASDRFFETDFSPGFNNYKLLIAHFLNYKIDQNIIFTTINSVDGFQDTVNFHLSHFRYTNGGRFEYTSGDYYFTLSGYYQHGETPFGTKLENAYYFQPEIKWNASKSMNFKIGAELLSGNSNPNQTNVSNSFDPLYGVNHRFLGSMDYFIRFPADLNNAGLIAPYLFTSFKINDKITFRADGHIFLSEKDFISKNQVIDKYLGFENDLLLIYKPNNFTTLQLGYSYLLPTESMNIIKKGSGIERWQDWAFLMITFKPNILNL
jgi:hypothetical protein